MDYDGNVATIIAINITIANLIRESLEERGFDTLIDKINDNGSVDISVTICY